MQTSLAFWIQSSNGAILRDSFTLVAKLGHASSTSLLEQLRACFVQSLEHTAELFGRCCDP